MPCPWATEQPWAFSVGFAGAQRRQEPSTAESHRCLLSRVCRLRKPPSRRRLHLGLHLRPHRFQVSKEAISARGLVARWLFIGMHPAWLAFAGGPSLASCMHKADDDGSGGCDPRAAAETDDAEKEAVAQVFTPPEATNTGPSFNRGSGGGARGCGFEERVGA